MRVILCVSLVIFNVMCLGSTLIFDRCKNIVNNTPLMRLKQYLLCNYELNIRPTENHRNKTVVSIAIKRQHYSVDEYSDTLNLHVLMKMIWKDEYLTWTPSEFDNIDSMNIMSDKIWVPDVTLHSASDTNMEEMSCRLQNTGEMYCLPKIIYSTYCETDHTWWPYDLMNCTIEIASWSYSTNDVILKFVKYDAKNDLLIIFKSNLQWEVVGVRLREHLTDSKFDSNLNTKMLSYSILLKRQAGMHNAVTVTIAIVLMTMTLMTLWLEPKSTERMVIANLNFVFHLLGLLQLQWVLPFSGNHLPKLLLFYEDSFIMASFSLILTSILRHLQELTVDAPVWISSATVLILNSRVGQIFLVNLMDPKVSARLELNTEDNTNLVSLDRKESTWRYTSILIGWFAFLSVLFTYVILLALLIPTSMFQNSVTMTNLDENKL